METLTKCTGSSPALRTVKIILMAALITTLFDGFASQAGAPPQIAAAPKAAEPITIELTQTGQLTSATDAKGVPLDPSASPAGGTSYRFSKGMMADPTNASVKIPANCISKQNESVGWCVPGDRSAWIRAKSGKILSIYYKSESGLSKNARKQHIVAPPPSTAPMAATAASCVRCVFGICLCM